MILLTTYDKTDTKNQQDTISIIEDSHLPLATQDYFSYTFKVIYKLGGIFLTFIIECGMLLSCLKYCFIA